MPRKKLHNVIELNGNEVMMQPIGIAIIIT